MDQSCHHPDIREYGTFRCCLSCGFALPLAIPAVETALDSNNEPEQGRQCHYRQLNYELGQEIRLIKLRPGEYFDPIICDIVHANLLNKPRYEALSYTWADQYGDDALSHRVQCARNYCDIQITANCDAALRRLRHKVTTRTIWIDAICINQNSIEERNHQVRQMGDIYASAEQVVVYLGEATFDSEDIFEYLGQAMLVQRDRSAIIGFPENARVPHPARMNRFLSRRWFHRVWVLQEVGLARKATVLCGERSLDWALFSVDRLSQGGLPTQTYPNQIYGSRERIKPGVLLLETDIHKVKPSLVELMHAGRNSLCKDPRDKVYALLSLASEDYRKNIQPDYSKEVDWIFTYVAVQTMIISESLDILSHVHHVEEYQTLGPVFHNLPSWAPNWTLSRNQRPFDNQFSSSELDFMATWNFHSRASQGKVEWDFDWRHPPNKSEILGRAHHTDGPGWSQRILRKNKTVFDTSSSPWILRGDHRIEDMCFQSSSVSLPDSLPSRISVRGHRLGTIYKASRIGLNTDSDGIFATYCPGNRNFWDKVHLGMKYTQYENSDVAGFGHIPPAFGGRCISCRTECKGSRCIRSENWKFSWHYNSWKLDGFLAQIARFGYSRKFFNTFDSIGIGPWNTVEGDTVWLLDTMKVAIVLRKVDRHFVVVGECHLHEALKQYEFCSMCGQRVERFNPIVTGEIEIW